MEVYFNYVYGKGNLVYGNLLFGEIMLCDNNSRKNFFIKAIECEIKKIQERSSKFEMSIEEWE